MKTILRDITTGKLIDLPRTQKGKYVRKLANESSQRLIKALSMEGKNNKTKRLTPRIHVYNSGKSGPHELYYVLPNDIKKFHGNKWFKKYIRVQGGGNTCPIIPANDASHGFKEDQFGIYYHDYERFADVVDHNKSTYWD